MASESPVEFQRDLRDTERRRSKTQGAKWSRGAMISTDGRYWEDAVKGTWSPRQKNEFIRPVYKRSDEHMFGFMNKHHNNIVKPRGTQNRWGGFDGRVREKIYAQREINDPANASDSLVDEALASPTSPGIPRRQSASEVILYSFDRTDTPGHPVTLDVFVKTTGRDTERLVEKEYEVIDANGEPLEGKKATRRNLRKNATDPGTALGPPPSDNVVEEDGFELV